MANNFFVDYTSKDVESFVANAKNNLRTFLPEYNNEVTQDPVMFLINQMGALMETVSISQNISFNESNPNTCQLIDSIKGWAKFLGYKKYTAHSASTYLMINIYPQSSDTPFFSGIPFIAEYAGRTSQFETDESFNIPAGEEYPFQSKTLNFVNIGAMSFSVNVSNLYSPGDYIYLMDYYDQASGQVNTVRHVDGQKVYVLEPIIKPLSMNSYCCKLIRAVQGTTVRAENLGMGTNTAFQQFSLINFPISRIKEKPRLVIEVNEEGRWVTWERKENIYDLNIGPDGRVYFYWEDANGRFYIFCGDGTRGKKFPLDAGVRATYKYGAGTSGNIPVGSISKILGSSPVLKRASNLLAGSGGRDFEQTNEIKRNLSNWSRTQDRCVVESDFINTAYRLRNEINRIWVSIDNNIVKLTIIPNYTDDEGNIPTHIKERIELFYKERMVDNMLLTIEQPNRVSVNVAYNVIYEEGYNPDSLRISLQQYVRNYFNGRINAYGKNLLVADLYALLKNQDDTIKVPGIIDFKLLKCSTSTDLIVESVIVDEQEIVTLGQLQFLFEQG